MAISETRLERQVRLALRCGYRPGRADEAVFGSGRVLHVTFDDALRSAEAGLAILARLGVPATVFACPDLASGRRRLDLPELTAEATAHPHELETMDWEALRGLCERGVEVGSHTLSHAHLTRLTNGELRRELVGSKDRIEEMLGRPCRYLAYPYGEDDSRVRAAAQEAGYTAAFGLPGNPLDPYSFPRVGLYAKDGDLRTLTKLTPPLRRAASTLRRVASSGRRSVTPR